MWTLFDELFSAGQMCEISMQSADHEIKNDECAMNVEVKGTLV